MTCGRLLILTAMSITIRVYRLASRQIIIALAFFRRATEDEGSMRGQISFDGLC